MNKTFKILKNIPGVILEENYFDKTPLEDIPLNICNPDLNEVKYNADSLVEVKFCNPIKYDNCFWSKGPVIENLSWATIFSFGLIKFPDTILEEGFYSYKLGLTEVDCYSKLDPNEFTNCLIRPYLNEDAVEFEVLRCYRVILTFSNGSSTVFNFGTKQEAKTFYNNVKIDNTLKLNLK